MESTKEEKYNVRLYPIYKMLSWDLLCYYSIIFLFLTQIKGISAADVLLGEAFYPIFKFLLLMPLTAFIEKMGKRKSIIVANAFNAISILSYILAQNFAYVLLGQFFSAIAFDIKGIAETNLLYDNLPQNEKRGSLFSKIDGKGTSWYYYADAIASVASGFLYIINGYLPLIICFVLCLVAVYLSCKFKKTYKEEQREKEKINFHMNEYMKKLKYSIRYMMQSKRLKYLLIFGATFSGFLSVLVMLRSGILEQIGLSEQYFGIIFAVLGIILGISAKNQNRFHNKFRNKTLAILSIPVVVSCIILGFIVMSNLSFKATLIWILVIFLVQYIARGPFYTLIRRYLNNFTTSSLRSKITSSYNLVESSTRSVIALTASFLLRITTASNATLVLGCILTLFVVLMLDKMSHKVGLKPEEYAKKEIEFLEIK